MKLLGSTQGQTQPTTSRQTYLRQRALEVCGRLSLVMSPLAIVVALVIDATCVSGPVWMHAPALGLAGLHVFYFWCIARYQRECGLPPAAIDRYYRRAIYSGPMSAGMWMMTLLTTSIGPDWLVQGLLIPGLIYGGLVMAPVRAGALLYILTFGAIDILSMPIGAAGDHTFQCLVAFYCMSSCALALWQHAEFARSACNEMKLAEQAEIIGILLHDFEEAGSDWLWETDANLRIRKPSKRLVGVLGCTRQTLAARSIRAWITGRLRHVTVGRDQFETLARCLDARLPFRDVCIPVGPRSRERWLLLTGKPILNQDGSFRGYRGVGSDVTATRRSEQQIAWLACHDSLTKLPNREQFHGVLDRACARQLLEGQPLAVLCLDLDGFKTINDTFGHAVGDELLVQVANRLRGCVREHDLIGRLGGDEFALLLPGGGRDSAGKLAQRLLELVSAPYEVNGSVVGVGVSIGVMLSPDDAPVEHDLSAFDLLKGADLAMYRAKQDGRGTVRFFEAGMRDDQQVRLQLQADLRHAIGRDELLVHFQPIMHSATGRIVAAEALVRWMHPTRGLIPPADFIPLAEESGLIVTLGTWVLRHACREAAAWSGDIGISVNLSPIQLRDPSLFSIIESALLDAGLGPERLELEITESLFLEPHSVVRETLSCLRRRGIRIALDDFGTGFSSLSYLRNFPIDTLKIDRSFVRDLGLDREAEMIVQAITDMAAGLGITITAEGVETADQEARLQASGCDQVQGYLYSRPCDSAAIRRFIGLQGTPSGTGQAARGEPAFATLRSSVSA